jgi:RNA polymerase sigma-70 factor, ECF subfamily
MKGKGKEDYLFQRFCEKDDWDSFEQLFDIIEPWLFRVIFKITDDYEVSKDIFQDTWVQIIEKKDDFDPDRGNITNFIFTIARNKALNWKKHKLISKKYESEEVTDVQDPIDLLESNQIKETIDKNVLKLANNYQKVIQLYFYGQLSIKEIAKILAKPEGTIKTWLSRARNELKILLSGIKD